MRSDYHLPLNLGTDRLVTVDEMVDIVCAIAKKSLGKFHDLTKPQGVRGRNSDNTQLRNVLGWEPSVALEAGLDKNYKWILKQIAQKQVDPPTETA